MPGFSADPESINHSANLFVEVASLLFEGRLDRDRGILCRVPHAHKDVAKKVQEIAEFADEQHGDLVLLLLALATKLKDTGQEYLAVDAEAQAALDRVLVDGQYVVPRSGG